MSVDIVIEQRRRVVQSWVSRAVEERNGVVDISTTIFFKGKKGGASHLAVVKSFSILHEILKF